MTAGQYGLLHITLATHGNDGQEVYTNNWQARATSLALPVISSDVTTTTPACLSVGNLVFNDVNKSSKYDSGDLPISGVLLDLMKASDNSVYRSTTTDSGGHYYFECVPPGSYYIRVNTTNFSSVLKGYQAAPNGSGNAADNKDETSDHDLQVLAGVYRSSNFTLNYSSEPTGEAGRHTGIDSNDNLTIDLGFVNTLNNGSLAGTGTNMHNWLAASIGISAVSLGLYLVTLRHWRQSLWR